MICWDGSIRTYWSPRAPLISPSIRFRSGEFWIIRDVTNTPVRAEGDTRMQHKPTREFVGQIYVFIDESHVDVWGRLIACPVIITLANFDCDGKTAGVLYVEVTGIFSSRSAKPGRGPFKGVCQSQKCISSSNQIKRLLSKKVRVRFNTPPLLNTSCIFVTCMSAH